MTILFAVSIFSVNGFGNGRCNIEGRVLDLLGSPLSNAKVIVQNEPAPIIAVTDKSGFYRLSNLGCGSQRVRFHLEGFREESLETTLLTNETKRFDIGLIAGELGDPPKMKISLRIRDTEDSTANFLVRIEAVFNRRVDFTVPVNADGTADFELRGYGQYRVEVVSPGKVTQSKVWVFHPEIASLELSFDNFRSTYKF